MLATPADKPFDDPDWLFEVKWDGVRAIAYLESGKTPRIRSRTGNDLLPQFPELLELRRAFASAQVIVDGELVALDRHGRSSFQRLQPRLNRRTNDPALQRAVPVTYVIFDLLYAGKGDLRTVALEKRKARLADLLRDNAPHIMLSKHVVGQGKKLFALAKRRALEGIIAKRRDSPYLERRTRLWLKIKTHYEQEAVIVGWTDPQGSRSHFGSLVLAVYDKGTLRYVGHVGTGFNHELLDLTMKKMKPLATKRCPFETVPLGCARCHWIRPKLVAEIKFNEWTKDGIMRQPVFVGLRSDKNAKDVVREN
ncbi:MAG: non-homologous end-joining DNA ligase [Candidatus Eremiobacteraeota bacterium]|nr:non-homologous end-joining DNA ligase [Candidatus Eremiobacteraeota bacterium]